METSNEYQQPPTFGDKNWSIYIEGEKVMKNVRWHIIDHIQGTSIKKHISKTANINMETKNNIDWDMN